MLGPRVSLGLVDAGGLAASWGAAADGAGDDIGEGSAGRTTGAGAGSLAEVAGAGLGTGTGSKPRAADVSAAAVAGTEGAGFAAVEGGGDVAGEAARAGAGSGGGSAAVVTGAAAGIAGAADAAGGADAAPASAADNRRRLRTLLCKLRRQSGNDHGIDAIRGPFIRELIAERADVHAFAAHSQAREIVAHGECAGERDKARLAALRLAPGGIGVELDAQLLVPLERAGDLVER